jgi:hypothetical protein
MTIILFLILNVSCSVVNVGIYLLACPEIFRQYSSAIDVLKAITSLCNRLSIGWLVLFSAYVSKYESSDSQAEDDSWMKVISEVVQPPFGFLGFAAFVTCLATFDYTITYILINDWSLPSADQRSTLHGYCIPAIHLIFLGIIFGGFEAREGQQELPLIWYCGKRVRWLHSARSSLVLAGHVLTGAMNGQVSIGIHVAIMTCIELLHMNLYSFQSVLRTRHPYPLLANWITIMACTVIGQAAGTLAEFLVKSITSVGALADIWTAPDPRKFDLIAMVCISKDGLHLRLFTSWSYPIIKNEALFMETKRIEANESLLQQAEMSM